MASTTLDSDALMRLTGQAVLTMLGRAERFEARAAPDLWMVLSGEPVADLNFIIAAGDSPDVATFESYVAASDRRDLPFAAMLGPEVSAGLAPICKRLELVHAVSWPLMVCPATLAESHPAPNIEVHPVRTEADAHDSAAVLAASFSMPPASAERAIPLASCALPVVDIHLARREGRALSTLTATRHDKFVGIWSMGTLPEAQGQGVGKTLLTRVMADERERGAEAFFLGATPAGLPLYKRLGYEAVADAQAWVRGETHQA